MDAHLYILKEKLSQKQKINPRYSIRAFARDLELHPSTLSHILKGDRKIPSKKIHSLMDNLDLEFHERAKFLESAHLSQHIDMHESEITKIVEKKQLEDMHYKIISDWEYYAVLALFYLPEFKPNIKEVSTRLGISNHRAKVVWQGLIDCNFITKNDDGNYERAAPPLKTSDDVMSLALREAHIQNIDLAKEKLESVPVELREFSSITLALAADDVPKIKRVLKELRLLVDQNIQTESPKHIFQLNLQFFPLTQLDHEGNDQN